MKTPPHAARGGRAAADGHEGDEPGRQVPHRKWSCAGAQHWAIRIPWHYSLNSFMNVYTHNETSLLLLIFLFVIFIINTD